LGLNSLLNNTAGSFNTSIGRSALGGSGSGSNNTGVGYNVDNANFSGCLILGKDAIATANNQAVFGSAGTNAGAITTEVVVSDTTWSVRINGTAYKILLKA
jgi:hypothetical protein